MSVFSIPFTSPSNYSYDADKIVVSGGLSSLKEMSLWDNLEVYYRTEESAWNGTPNEVIDETDNNIHATASGANTVATGKIGRCASFDGINDYVVSTDNIPATLYGNVDFTISFWLYVPVGPVMTGSSYRHFFSFGAPTVGNLCQITTYDVVPNILFIGWFAQKNRV